MPRTKNDFGYTEGDVSGGQTYRNGQWTSSATSSGTGGWVKGQGYKSMWPVHKSSTSSKGIAATTESAASSGLTNTANGFQNQSLGYLGAAGGSLGSMQGMANSFRDRFNQFTPLTNDYVRAVKQYDPQFLVDQAAMDVNSSYDKSRGIMERNLLRYGVNPNSGRFASLQNDWARALAAAEAGAKTKAKRQVYMDRISTLGNAAQMGNTFGSQAMSGYGNVMQGNMAMAGQYGELAAGAGGLQAYQDERNSAQGQLNDILGIGGGSGSVY